MQNGIKHLSDDKILRDWIDSIPRGKYNAVIAELLDECLVSRFTLSNWRYGRCRIPATGKRDINRVSLRHSGKEIFTIVKPGQSPKA